MSMERQIAALERIASALERCADALSAAEPQYETLAAESIPASVEYVDTPEGAVPVTRASFS